MNESNCFTGRIASAIPEQRRELDVSLRELERLSGVSRSTISKVERGVQVRPHLVLQIAATLTVLELYAPPKPPAGPALDDELAGVLPYAVEGNGARLWVAPAAAQPLATRPRLPLVQPFRSTLGGAA